MTATGNPGGGTFAWTAGSSLQVSGANSQSASVSGTAATSAGGTWVAVAYTLNNQTVNASVRFTVLNPTTFQASSPYGGDGNTQPYVTSGTTAGYVTAVNYYLYDQTGTQISLPGITNSEVLSTTSNPYSVEFSPPDGQPKSAGSGNDRSGSMSDLLTAYFVPGGLPAGFSAQRSQAWTVNGYAFTPAQTQTYAQTFAMVTSQTFNRQ